MPSKLEVLSLNPIITTTSFSPKMGKCRNKFENAFIMKGYFTEY
jgi:hypothetical protein